LEQFNLSDEQIRTHVTRALEAGTQFGLRLFSDFITALPQIFLFSVVLVLATFVFLIGAEHFQKFFQRIFRMKDLQRERYVQIFQSCAQQVFLSNVLTGFLQSVVVTLGALLSGYPELFLIFFITFVTSFIPILGAGPVALVLSVAGFLNQDYSAGIIMLITSAVAGSSDNLLRPYLATLGEVKVPVFLSFLSVLGGVLVLGLPGLFVGPLVISWAWGLLPVIYRDLFPAEVD
jgi:predicted PurR-regulated permease PerM